MSSNPIVITSTARTPMGNFQGELSSLTASELGAYAISGARERISLPPEIVNEVYMGCVLPAGQGQAPARQAALLAKLPTACGATTINKMCGSGMKALMFAHDILLSEPNHVLIAGGMESMSNAPYLLKKARSGYRLGHDKIIDHMFLDGLEDAYEKGTLMGCFADRTAKDYGFTRDNQDEFAIISLTRAQNAAKNDWFRNEIVSVTTEMKKQTVIINSDEGPRTAKPEKIRHLKPAFAIDGTVTAANSSSISDGAAALVLMREQRAQQLGLTPLAKIVGHASHAQQPGLFTTAPAFAIKKLLEKVQWQVSDVDLFEINEAFAVVTMAAMHDLSIPHDITNIYGGACVLGHPIGASGARIVVTLLNALTQNNLKRGVASLCIGGGEATALAIERL